MEKLITKSFKRLLDKGIHRGFITYEELGKSLGKRHFSQNNIESAFLHIFDNKISLVEKKSDYSSNKKRDSASSDSDSEKYKDVEKSDDPIRMYLREMGGVELLSREGEIAIAKRIEAGKDVMINALTQSPIIGKKISEWREQIENQQLLVRDIIDIDSTYEDFEALDDDDDLKINKKAKTQKDKDNELKDEKSKEEENSSNEDDEFNVSLAKMEEEIKPKIINILDSLNKNYSKLQKYQLEKLQCLLDSKELSVSKNKNFKKIQEILVDNFKNLQLAPHVVEELVQSHYKENKKIVSLEGVLLRLAMDNKISREEFLKYYVGNEINPKFESFLNENAAWKSFFKKKKKEFSEIRERLIEFSKKIELPIHEFKKLVRKIQKGEKAMSDEIHGKRPGVGGSASGLRGRVHEQPPDRLEGGRAHPRPRERSAYRLVPLMPAASHISGTSASAYSSRARPRPWRARRTARAARRRSRRRAARPSARGTRSRTPSAAAAAAAARRAPAGWRTSRRRAGRSSGSGAFAS